MEYILYVYMVMAVGAGPYREWRANGEYSSYTTCDIGARQLGYTSANFKCVKK